VKTFSKSPSEKEFAEISCGLCGSSRYRRIWKSGGIPFVKCRSCGLVYQNPQPVQEQLLGRYDEEYFDYEKENEANFLNLMKLGLRDVGFFGREAQIRASAEALGRTASFLDIGCATGALIEYLGSSGWNAEGVEVCAPSARFGIEEKGLNIHIGTLEAAGFPDSSFDVVHCSHLIEHLTDPDAFIAETARILRPGGIVIIVTPDISGFQALLFRGGWRSAINDHMHLFSKKTLSKLLRKHGFVIQKSVSWGGLAAGTAPKLLKSAADRIVKPLGAGDVVCIMGMI